MKKALSLMLALVLCLSMCACGGGTQNVAMQEESSDNNTNASGNTTPAFDIPNNGEWDEILCSGDGYYLVKKTIDTYNEYNLLIGVIDQSGEWIHELTEEGTFVEGVRFRALGNSKTLIDSDCYMYLGEGVFLASPGVSVYTKDDEYRIGPWENSRHVASPTGRIDVSIWECLIWNVVDNIQKEISASKMSTFNDGYLLFCEEDKYGSGELCTLNKNGDITELPCKYLPNKPAHNFPVYAEGLFYACSESSTPGFYDISGNRVINLSQYDVGRIWYSSSQNANAPYFENGQAIILFQNAGGNVFKAIIDKTGAFIGEPQKMDGNLTY